MPLSLKLKKSAGVPVTAAVQKLIRKGDAARNLMDWSAAACHYREALKHDNTLVHVWVQLGHMLKEAGLHAEAVDAYTQAQILKPSDFEPLRHIGHLRNALGDHQAAADTFLQVVRNNPADTAAIYELSRLTARVWQTDISALRQAATYQMQPALRQAAPHMATLAIDRLLDSADAISANDNAVLQSARAVLTRLESDQDDRPESNKIGIVFDVTDLIAHFRHHRLPTGIQRVQIEVIGRALTNFQFDIRVCCFTDGCNGLVEIPNSLFKEVIELSTKGKDSQDPAWQLHLARLALHFLTAPVFTFKYGDTLVNMGTSWFVYNYFLFVRNAKREYNIRYVPLVHDLIPIMAAEHCVSGVVEDYISWLIGIFDHTDHFLVNSVSTGNDLVLAAKRLGRNLTDTQIEVVTLDADFRQPTYRTMPAQELDRWSLKKREYALLVSTIESRKNHILALDAWAQLIEKYGADKTPTLVCVGRNGWMNSEFYDRLSKNIYLQQCVVLIERVSDDELALLYRECAFTVYPSHYEGWGLPVTESLCYGRVPIVADNSSLREAGGDFSVFFESNSVSAFVDALERTLFEAGFRENLEREIEARYQPRSWASITNQITQSVLRLAHESNPSIPTVLFGQYYPVSLHKGVQIWRGLASGEIFRIGTGWLWPEIGGSRITAEGGYLRIQTSQQKGTLRLYIRLQGLSKKDSGFVISSGDTIVANGRLHAGEQRWVLGDIPSVHNDGIILLFVKGDSVEDIQMVTAGTPKPFSASISVVGFSLVEKDDEVGRFKFLENVALSDIDQVNPYAKNKAGG